MPLKIWVAFFESDEEQMVDLLRCCLFKSLE